MAKDVVVAIVGLGYWGPNLLRNFAKTPGVRVKTACDKDVKTHEKFGRQYPAIAFTDDLESVLNDPEIDAVAVATPVKTHYPITKAALEKGKHVLVEKPLASSIAEANELVSLAEKQKKVLLVDHTFVYEPAIAMIKSYIDDGTLGKILYFDSTRVNLGLIQKDTNVLWDLAVHDLSILAYLRPLSGIKTVAAHGSMHHTKNEEVGHLHLTFEDGMAAHIHVSWLSPVKLRQTLIGGTDKMIVYNDNEPSEKIRLYDKGVTVSPEEQTFALPVYRSGDVLIPRIQTAEPLGTLAAHFAACIRGEEKPRTPGSDGAAVVTVLERAMVSLKEQRPVPLQA